MITIIHEHSIDLDLLPEKAVMCDIGCRGFQWTEHFREKGHFVYPIDIDTFQNRVYYQCCICGENNGRRAIHRINDPQATRAVFGNDVACYTLEGFSEKVGVPFWDHIKTDIEGAEYEMIMALKNPIAKQIAIEFHLHTGIYGMAAVQEMEIRLRNLGYHQASHSQTSQHGAGLNFWNSLFILK